MFLHPRALVFKDSSLRQISLALKACVLINCFLCPWSVGNFCIEKVQHRAVPKKFCHWLLNFFAWRGFEPPPPSEATSRNGSNLVHFFRAFSTLASHVCLHWLRILLEWSSLRTLASPEASARTTVFALETTISALWDYIREKLTYKHWCVHWLLILQKTDFCAAWLHGNPSMYG